MGGRPHPRYEEGEMIYIHLTIVVLICTASAGLLVTGQWQAGMWAGISAIFLIHWHNSDKDNKGLSKAYAEANEEILRLSAVLGNLGYTDDGQKMDGN